MSIRLTADQETIIAQCTPQGPGAIALLRLSGVDAFEIATKIGRLSSKQPLIDQPSHTIHYGTVVDERDVTIDQVMFLLMRAPKTFTGDDTLEITCHNNPFIIEHIIERAIENGARLAQEGEFTRRAVLNNKMNLIQAEAIAELIHANTQLALKKSLAQIEGSFSNWVIKIEQELLKTLAYSEASFEFIDDEITFGEQIRLHISNVLDDIISIKKTFNQQQHIRQGIRIAIIGSVNAGKSSLFNALLNRNRAIVTPFAGTTRDVLEAGIYTNGNYWTLVDTAGLRQTADVIEQEGIKRSYEQAQLADIVLLVFDSSHQLSSQEQETYDQLLETYRHKTIVVHNKQDIATVSHPSQHPLTIRVSSTTKTNIDQLQQIMEEKVKDLFNRIESPFLLNQRHFNLLSNLEKRLIAILSMFSGNIAYELVSYELKDVLTCLSELTGKTISEKGMDAVFKQFCVGK